MALLTNSVERLSLGWTKNSDGTEWPSMKTARPFILAFTMGVALTLQAIAETQADIPLYGAYPANYKEIVTQWLNKQLIDPDSARIEWNGEPKSADLGKNGEHLYGYLVNFTVNARNRFGGYTGNQKHAVLIRNGEVIKGLGFGY
jgi:hypothetical protein